MCVQLDYLNEAIDRLPVKLYRAAAFSLEICLIEICNQWQFGITRFTDFFLAPTPFVFSPARKMW
jgi:hypothetical protein